MKTEALKSAIEFAEYCLEELDLSHMASNQAKRLVEKAKEALAQPEQEPVAHIHRNEYNEYRLEPHDNFDIKSIPFNVDVPLFKSPRRKPLTDEEIGAILEGVNAYGTRLYTFARAIEAAHGIKE